MRGGLVSSLFAELLYVVARHTLAQIYLYTKGMMREHGTWPEFDEPGKHQKVP